VHDREEVLEVMQMLQTAAFRNVRAQTRFAQQSVLALPPLRPKRAASGVAVFATGVPAQDKPCSNVETSRAKPQSEAIPLNI